jgi:alkanesulfonate monooxygenase SsuD/methylene tetrahydromethanopterin reductase-like flavin-dependent oxidoreductase (luciferase family)
MRYLVEVPNFGEFAAPGVFAEVARRAEETGWDALLVWDHVAGEKDLRWEIADPWILLTAAALATRRIRLGTAITPVARRRPSKLAREVTTLDRLTGGRMILGAGLGTPVAGEYGSFGDTTDTRVLAERLDEGLHALDLLWSGEPVTYRATRSRSMMWFSCRLRYSARGCRSGSEVSGRTRRRCGGRHGGTGPSRRWRISRPGARRA